MPNAAHAKSYEKHNNVDDVFHHLEAFLASRSSRSAKSCLILVGVPTLQWDLNCLMARHTKNHVLIQRWWHMRIQHDGKSWEIIIITTTIYSSQVSKSIYNCGATVTLSPSLKNLVLVLFKLTIQSLCICKFLPAVLFITPAFPMHEVLHAPTMDLLIDNVVNVPFFLALCCEDRARVRQGAGEIKQVIVGGKL